MTPTIMYNSRNWKVMVAAHLALKKSSLTDITEASDVSRKVDTQKVAIGGITYIMAIGENDPSVHLALRHAKRPPGIPLALIHSGNAGSQNLSKEGTEVERQCHPGCKESRRGDVAGYYGDRIEHPDELGKERRVAEEFCIHQC